MATLASILQLEEHESCFEFLVEELHHPTYDSLNDHSIYTMVGHESSRYSSIFSYLCDHILPKNIMSNEKCQLIQNSSHSGDLEFRWNAP